MIFDPIKIAELEELQSGLDSQIMCMRLANENAESDRRMLENIHPELAKSTIKYYRKNTKKAENYRKSVVKMAGRIIKKSKELITI
jgi:hypothetical protein